MNRFSKMKMKKTEFIDRHISSVPILQCGAASRRRRMPLLLLLVLAIMVVQLAGCTFDVTIDGRCGSTSLATGGKSDSSDLKMTRDYANHSEDTGSRILESVVIKTVMTCKNQGMKFVKWARRCKYDQNSLTEQSYKCVAVFIAFIL